MPRLIATTWFENLSWWNQPMFDFRFVRLSPRQTLYAGIFAALAYIVASWLVPAFTASIIWQVGAGFTVFIVGMGVFARRGSVYPPEWYLWHFLEKRLPFTGRRFRGGSARKARRAAKGKAAGGPRPRVAPMIVPLGEPSRIAGVLYDPSSGDRASNVNFEVLADGEPYHTGRTDKDGSFSFIFTPPGPGKYVLEVRPEGFEEGAQRVIVESQPGGGSSRDRRAMGRDTLEMQPGEALEPEPEEEESEEGEEELYTYKLYPMNFVDLSPRDQDKIVDQYRRFLNTLDRRVKMIVKRTKKEVELGGKVTEVESHDYYVQAEDPIDAQLDAGGLKYQRTAEPLDPEVVDVHRSFVIVSGGSSERTATVTRLPSKLVEGFPAELYGVADRLTIDIRPLDQGEAVKRVERFTRLQQALTFRGTGGREEESKATRAQEMLRRLTEEQSKLFEVKINVTVGGSTEEELKEKMERLESICRGRLVRTARPIFIQEGLIRGEMGKELTMDTITLGAFFPFVSSDVMETPGGIFLGVNRRTGSPVIYDPYIRSSPHVALIARTGGGKSFAAKTYMTRLFEKHPDLAFFVIDPEDEYTVPALALDRMTQVIDVKRNEPLGLDPLKLFSRSKDVVVDMLRRTLNLQPEESDLYSELRIGVERAGSLQELRDHAGKKLGKRLDGLLEGPQGFLFEGETLTLSDRAVFNLKELHEAWRLSDEEVGPLHTASLLLFGKIWRKIEELPPEKLKVVVVDEVWLYTQLPSAAAFLEHLSRRGRRRNVVFILASQRPADVLKSESGRAAIENCATKIFLLQDEAATDLLGKTFNLTERELDECTRWSPGECILSAGDVKVPLKVVASPSEYARFTTKPGEVGAR